MPREAPLRSAVDTPQRGTVAHLMSMPRKFQRRSLEPPCPYVLPNNAIGVELEYENARAMARRILDPAVSSGYWNVTTDASLRDQGEEFVLREGLEGLELAYAIREFFTLAEGQGLVENGRTSCHVHVDMRDADLELLRSTVLVYQAVEKMFWSMVHRQRRWTGYCIPLAEAQGALVALLFSNNAAANSRHLVSTSNAVTRYSGLNVASISRHGTVEFRHFNNPTGEAQMNEWINVCMSVKVAGAALVAAVNGAAGGVLRAVNEDSSLVVRTVMANTILATACATANITESDMQLAVDQLLAITESLHPTNGVVAPTTLLSADDAVYAYGDASGIRYTGNGRICADNHMRLRQVLHSAIRNSGYTSSQASSYSELIARDTVASNWPMEISPETGQDTRRWVRSRLNDYLTGAAGPAARATCADIYGQWEQYWDAQNAGTGVVFESSAEEQFAGEQEAVVPEPTPASRTLEWARAITATEGQTGRSTMQNYFDVVAQATTPPRAGARRTSTSTTPPRPARDVFTQTYGVNPVSVQEDAPSYYNDSSESDEGMF